MRFVRRLSKVLYVCFAYNCARFCEQLHLVQDFLSAFCMQQSVYFCICVFLQMYLVQVVCFSFCFQVDLSWFCGQLKFVESLFVHLFQRQSVVAKINMFCVLVCNCALLLFGLLSAVLYCSSKLVRNCCNILHDCNRHLILGGYLWIYFRLLLVIII